MELKVKTKIQARDKRSGCITEYYLYKEHLISFIHLICFNTWGWSCAPLQKRTFHCAASSASEPKRKPVRATFWSRRTQRTCTSFPMHRRARVLYISWLTLQINPQSTDHEAEFECCYAPPKPSEKVSRGCASLFHLNLTPAEWGPAIFQMRRAQKGLIPNTPLFSRVSWIKSAEHRSECLLSFYLWCNAAGIYDVRVHISSKEWRDNHPDTCITIVTCLEHVDKDKTW